jgi:acetate kinase
MRPTSDAKSWTGSADPSHLCTLAVNGGSSSLKFAVFAAADPPERVISGRIERVGQEGSRLRVRDAHDGAIEERAVDAPDQAAAAALVVDVVRSHIGIEAIVAVGHRIVHGGSELTAPTLVTPDVLTRLRRLAPLDPEHLPGEIALLEAFARAIADVPQVACFDTAFHRDLPPVARMVPIPRRYWANGVRRYGFHGISYAYLLEELRRIAPAEARGRVIFAHLGSGASLAAVRDGRCVETTMGFTPASGVVMGTRCGDLDPGLVAFLARVEGMSPERFHRLCSRESGLLGVSETSSDVRDLIARRADDPRAGEAIELFGYRVRTAIGSLAAALGGLDALVFSGGIGENEPEIRALACSGLGFLGVALDEARNAESAARISQDASPTAVRVIATDEELMLAREAIRLARADVRT